MRYEAHGLACLMTTQIAGGTSGSPIVTDDALIVGVVSHATETTDPEQACIGIAPRPHLTLPRWALRLIAAYEDKEGSHAAARMAWYEAAIAALQQR